MPQEGWKNINFPEKMVGRIEKLISNPYVQENYAFGSVPEFLRNAARDLIERIRKEIEEETGIRP